VIYKTTAKSGSQKTQGMGGGPKLTKSLDRLYLGKHVIIHFVDGTSIEGIVIRYTMFWLQVKLNNGRMIYVNKGSVKFIEEVGEEKEKNKVGGSANGNSKVKK
jgi:hypothetical protein